MRRGEALAFWTGLGAAVMGFRDLRISSCSESRPMPDPLPERAPRREALLGMQCTGSRARHIYERSWEILGPLGWSKALRLEPWPDTELFLPFHRGDSAVVPQGFSGRVPPVERALALVGKAAAARCCGVDLTVVLARWTEDVVGILTEGGTRCCSLDRLAAAVEGRAAGRPGAGV